MNGKELQSAMPQFSFIRVSRVLEGICTGEYCDKMFPCTCFSTIYYSVDAFSKFLFPLAIRRPKRLVREKYHLEFTVACPTATLIMCAVWEVTW